MELFKEDKLDKCAFLVGNGINLYKKSRLDWKELIKELFQNEKDMVSESFLPLSFEALLLDGNERDYRKKKKIVEILKNQEEFNAHKKFVNYAKEHNCPILTTNYDELLITDGLENICKVSKKNGLHKPYNLSNVSSNKRCRLPLDCYYSDKKISLGEDIKNKFAIWNIHGMMYYQNSLCVSLSDYFRLREKLKEVQKNDSGDINTTYRKDNTWLDIFLNSNLIIFGLGLNIEEIDLYWLLLIREKYKKNDLKTYYIYKEADDKDKDVMEEKIKLLTSLNIKCISFKSYDEIYQEYDVLKA